MVLVSIFVDLCRSLSILRPASRRVIEGKKTMSKVAIDMSMSLDGFVAGPDDGKAHPLGTHGGEHVFDWYFSGKEQYRDPVFRPEPGPNKAEVERMFAE